MIQKIHHINKGNHARARAHQTAARDSVCLCCFRVCGVLNEIANNRAQNDRGIFYVRSGIARAWERHKYGAPNDEELYLVVQIAEMPWK